MSKVIKALATLLTASYDDNLPDHGDGWREIAADARAEHDEVMEDNRRLRKLVDATPDRSAAEETKR